MTSKSFLSLAEIKTIKCIHCLRDLILNLVFFYYVVDETIKELSQKQIKRKFTYFHCHYCWNAGNQECLYGLFCLIQWKTEQGNAPQVKYSAISPLLMITWWNINWVFSPVVFIFHWLLDPLFQKNQEYL